MASVSDNLAPPAVEMARRWLKREREDNATRDQNIKRLNNAYASRLFDLDADSDNVTLTRTMKDSTATNGQGSNPRYSEVPVPMVRSITEDWKSVMAITPNHMCPPASPGEDASEREADRREQIVGGVYYDSCLDIRVQEGSHYRTLHGAELLHCLPDPDDHRVRIDTRSPYRCYARLLNRRRELMYMAWDWEEVTEYVLSMWPAVERTLGEEDGVFRKGGQTRFPDKLLMSEWYDRTNRVVFASDKWVEDMPWAEHNWGFVPGFIIPNIVGVGLWGESDVQHAVHLSQLYSELLSMMQDGIFQSIYDVPIIFDDNQVGKIEVGPHEALQMSSKARTGSLRQNVKMPEGNLILDILERVARIGSGWPKVQSSEMDSPVISGKAFVAAQGPVAARAAIKHVVYALGLERVTSYALKLYEKHFPDEEIKLMSLDGRVRTAAVASRSAMGTPLTFVPSRDIAGNHTVIINFPPGGSDQYRHTIEQLQLKEAGIISAETVRQQRPGIDPRAERLRIERETRETANLQAEGATIMARAQLAVQQEAMVAAAQAQMQAQGGMAPGQPQPGQQPQQSQQPQQGQGPVPALQRERREPERTGRVQAAQQGGGNWGRISRAEVRQEIAGARPIRGRVFLMGALARLGWTTGMVELGLTDLNDKAVINQKTVYGRQGRIVYQEVPLDSVQNEAMLNITP